MRARPGSRTRLYAAPAVPPVIGVVLFSLLVSSPVERALTAAFAVAVCVMCALLWRLERSLRRAHARYPLDSDTDPVRSAAAVREVERGRTTGDPETDRLGRAVAESAPAFHTCGFLGFSVGALAVSFWGAWIVSLPGPPGLSPGEVFLYTARPVAGAVLLTALWPSVLRLRRRARAFIAAHDRGTA
ncbi:hypothetical protein SUDANB121_03364 [Nocardiopsis dassonvillei]|uniref:hypothetical protein n=1 Tax=Nocardiopsis dassonvillei TaxID=2014 RepID=UPI003F54961E